MKLSWILFFVIIPCSVQRPRIIVDLTEHVNEFQNSTDPKSRIYIEAALSYSPSVLYQSNEYLDPSLTALQELSELLDKVCKESDVLECDISQINLYFVNDVKLDFDFYRSQFSKFSNLDAPNRLFKSFIYIFEWKYDVFKKYTDDQAETGGDILETGLFMNTTLLKSLEKSRSYRLGSVGKKVHRLFVSVPMSYPQGVPESFPLFRNYLTEIINLFKKVENTFQTDAWEKFHLVINFSYSGANTSIRAQYETLILKFVNQLVHETNISTVISGVTIPSNFTDSEIMSQVVVGRDVHPITRFAPPSKHDDLLQNQVQINGKFSAPFKAVLINGIRNVVEYLERGSNDNRISNKTTIVWIEVENTYKLFPSLSILLAGNQSLPKKLGIEIQTVFFSEEIFHDVDSNVSQLIKDSQLNIGCSIFLADGSEWVIKSVPSNAEIVLLQFDLNLAPFVNPSPGVAANYYLETVQSKLAGIFSNWTNYQVTSSGKQRLVVDIWVNWAIEDSLSSCIEYDNTYCNSCMSKVNEAVEAILIWGKIHDVEIVLLKLFPREGLFSSKGYEAGWYQSIKGGNNRGEIFLPRCQPLRLLDQENACIYQARSVPQDGIQLNSSFSGVTINSRLRNGQNFSGGFHGVKVMSEFALNRFKMVEILLSSDEKCSAATTIGKLVQSKHFKIKSEVRLFLDYSLEPGGNVSMLTQIECVSKLSETVANSVGVNISAGVHLSNWENRADLMENLSQIKQSKISIGLTVRNCEALRKTLKKTCRQPLISVDYIVCLTDSIEASNKDLAKMTKYLDAKIYLSKILPTICSHLRVYFRLKSYQTQQPFVHLSTSDFLTFIGDLVEFSEKYEIPIFLAEVFDRPDANVSGWWRLTNQTDFENPNAYIEKEAEHLGKPTWRPNPKNKNLNSDSQLNLVINVITASVGILTLAAIFIIVVWVKYLRTKQRLVLSEETVKNVLNGESVGEDEMETSFDLRFQPKFKYDPKFEIALSRFDFLGAVELGSGFFGKVYKIKMGNEWVAVKRPNPACSEQGLISMLEEIKILCYVGQHEHVLRFVGCSTISASRGIIYIATELCEKGCLQTFLTSLSSEVKPGEDNRTTFHLLNQFSFQIASGMEYIASRRIIHSDLATRNVLLDSHLTCKIGDFGLSRKLYANDLYESQGGRLMPWRWMAVESLKRREYSVASDVWSYGVTIWEIFSLGDFPYSEISSTEGFVERLENGLRLLKPVHMSDTTFDQICGCWELNTSTRPTFTKLKQFFQFVPSDVYIEL